MKNASSGFTLIELLVSIAVISVLAAVITFSVTDAQRISRDSDRAGNLRIVQTALEQYKSKYGTYPLGCNAGSGVSVSGQPGMSSQCPGGNPRYIEDLVPEFLPSLPNDVRGGSDAGYVYILNTDASVYKFMSQNAVEVAGITATEDHPFFRCDAFCLTNNPSTAACTNASLYGRTLAVSGGIATDGNVGDTANIRCY